MLNNYLIPEMMLVLGQSRSGKSTLLKMIFIMFWLKLKGKTIYFDIFNSAKNSILLAGGKYIDPGDYANQKLHAPLQALPKSLAFAFFCEILQLKGIDITPKKESLLLSAIEMIHSLEKKQRTITNIIPFIQDDEIRDALKQYSASEGLYSIFDSDTEIIDFKTETIIGIESKLLFESEKISALILLYIFFRIEHEAKGQPILIIFDDASLAFSSEIVVKKLHTWINNLKKRNVFMIFSIHQLSDINHKLKEVVLNHTDTRIFTPNSAIESSKMVRQSYEELGLNERQLLALSNATKQRDYMIHTTDGKCQIINLLVKSGSLTQEMLGGSSIGDIQFMNRLLEQYPSEEAFVKYLDKKVKKE